MKINSLKINSFGKIKNKEINFSDKINIIYGKNEAGKSTILNFIVSSFYGISKNKKGKKYSNYDIYKPWIGEDFSGNLEYELDNNEKYIIHREFNKRNPKIFNEQMEEISKQFNIDKSLGNEFFYEQTGVDEELFESTVLIKQREIELEKNKEGNLIQKITNIVGTGEDNISYKKAIKKLEKKQLDEIGTSRSREKPINILERKIQELQNKKSNLENYENKKYEMEEQKEFYLEKINKVEKEAEFLKQEEKIELELQLEKEKIKLKKELIEKNNKKIKELESDKINIEKNKDNKKRLENQRDNKKKKKKSKIVLIMVISLVLMLIAEIMLIKNTFLNILLPIVILVEVFIYLILRKREKN